MLFPADIIAHLSLFCNIRTQARMRQVCRLWARVVKVDLGPQGEELKYAYSKEREYWKALSFLYQVLDANNTLFLQLIIDNDYLESSHYSAGLYHCILSTPFRFEVAYFLSKQLPYGGKRILIYACDNSHRYSAHCFLERFLPNRRFTTNDTLYFLRPYLQNREDMIYAYNLVCTEMERRNL